MPSRYRPQSFPSDATTSALRPHSLIPSRSCSPRRRRALPAPTPPTPPSACTTATRSSCVASAHHPTCSPSAASAPPRTWARSPHAVPAADAQSSAKCDCATASAVDWCPKRVCVLAAMLMLCTDGHVAQVFFHRVGGADRVPAEAGRHRGHSPGRPPSAIALQPLSCHINAYAGTGKRTHSNGFNAYIQTSSPCDR